MSLLNADGSRVANASVMTDATGAFKLTGVTPGNHLLAADADSYARAQQSLAVNGNIEGVIMHLDPQGDQTLQLTADCAKALQTLTFPVHRGGSVLVEGTARGFQVEYILLALSLDGTTHIADKQVAISVPGGFVQLPTAVPGPGEYRASITSQLCYPVELRVTAPR
jgi:hypothetical protein